MIHMISEANKLGWEIKAAAQDEERKDVYHVLVYREKAPFQDRKYSLHQFSTITNGFFDGHYDLSEELAYHEFRSRKW